MNEPNFNKRTMLYRTKNGKKRRKNFIVAIIVDFRTKEVLMQAFMDKVSFGKTKETGFVHLWSFSRNELWLKGETSGNKLVVKNMALDCDGDCLKIEVEVLGEGKVCHTGERTCFFDV